MYSLVIIRGITGHSLLDCCSREYETLYLLIMLAVSRNYRQTCVQFREDEICALYSHGKCGKNEFLLVVDYVV